MRKRDAAVAFVVVAVCLFLVGRFVLPRLARAREGRRDSCLNRLKGIGLGVSQYAQDFDNVYPWQVGVGDSRQAWRDLGMLYPNYVTRFRSFLCPSSRDRKLKAPRIPDEKGPLDPFAADLAISYSYCVDAREALATAWTWDAPSTVRLAADKKAGTAVGTPGNPAKLAAHSDDGRNVLYNDGHVRWEPGPHALDPDEDGDAIGEPKAKDYRDWWSNPPYYGE